MMARPPVRTEEGMLGSILRRLTLVERRVTKTPAGLPARLGPEGQGVTDWNDALLPGFYWGDSDALNAPFADRFVGQVYVISGGALAGRIVQEVRIPSNQSTGRAVWRRTYDVGWGLWRLANGVGEGTTAQRNATTPRYFDKWYDTSDGFIYVGNKSGGWRRFNGAISDTAKAWATTQGASGSAMVAGRSVAFTIPTTLETRETLQITMDPALTTSGFNFIGATGLVRNPTNTDVTVRLMQLASFTTQPIQIAWQIHPF